MTTVTSEPTAAQWDDFLYLKFSLVNGHFPVPFPDVLWIGQFALLKQNTNHAFIRLLGRTKPRRGNGGKGGLPLFIKNQLLWFWNANQIKISTRPGGLIYILNELACCERPLLLPPLSLSLFSKENFWRNFCLPHLMFTAAPWARKRILPSVYDRLNWLATCWSHTVGSLVWLIPHHQLIPSSSDLLFRSWEAPTKCASLVLWSLLRASWEILRSL